VTVGKQVTHLAV